MKTSRLLAALLLTASPAVAKAAVTQTVPELDGTRATFIVGNVFDSWYEVHYRGGVGAGNVSRTVNDSSGTSETYAPTGTLPDHDAVYTARHDSMTAGKAVVANGAAAGSRSNFGGAGEGGGGGASGQSSGPAAAKPDAKTSGDTTPAEGLKSLTADTFLASFPGTLQLQPGAGQGVPAGGALEDPVDWRWASLQDPDKSAWKFADGAGGASTAEEEPEDLTTDNPDTRRNLNLKNQPSVRRFTVVSAPEPAGALTMTGFLGLALFSRRRSAIRL
ncbi:MAG: hypothetical protein EOP86_20330 [Verrucomicrobiaceae bacterium]|nr:MAG: hypothetical protein EOP86_20330 [Verrucomicrobiaceae bacterium]